MKDGWSQLERFLTTDPHDAGCEQAMDALHVYVELVRADNDPEELLPGIAAHLAACGPCHEDFEGLLASVQGAAERG